MIRILAKMRPKLSIAKVTHEYFERIFVLNIFKNTVYNYWDLRRNCTDYNNIPNSLRMDLLIERCWDLHRDDYCLSFLHH